MLAHLVARLKRSKFGDRIVLCTSTVRQDDPLEDFANQYGIACFRGHPDDVLARNYEAACVHGFDLVLSCTGDNPFVDEIWMDILADEMVKQKADFGTISGLPFGSHCYSFKTSAAGDACQMKEDLDTEIWGPYFTQTGKFRCIGVDVDDPAHRAPELRLTVDEPKDFEVAKSVLEGLKGKLPPDIPDIIAFLRERPEIARLNAGVNQKAANPIRIKK